MWTVIVFIQHEKNIFSILNIQLDIFSSFPKSNLLVIRFLINILEFW